MLSAPSTSGATTRQEDLFAAVWHLLKRLAEPSGCLLLVEDLHWADPDSLKLLSYMARETADINLWLVATYRTDELHRRHPLTATLAELSRDRFTTRTVESVLAIQVRAGLHTGECRVTGNDLSGLAVHIASRLCDLAGTREVLVSGTVRDLVIGSTLSFEDRGVRTLKGVPGEWHLLGVSADNR